MTPPVGKPRRSKPKSPQEKSPPTAGPASSSDSSPSPLGLAGDAFVKPEKAPPAATASDLERLQVEPPKPPPPEWKPESLEPVLKGVGRIVHSLDPLSQQPGGEELWKLTEEDAREIAAPMSRIANRYATLRGAASFSDEIGVVATVLPYVKKNLAERGRVRAMGQLEERPSQPERGYQPETHAVEPRSQPESPPERQQDVQPGPGLADRAGSEEDLLRASKQGVGEAFEHALPTSDAHLPPLETERG